MMCMMRLIAVAAAALSVQTVDGFLSAPTLRVRRARGHGARY